MHHRSLSACLALGVSLAFAPARPVQAYNPRVTLKAEEATGLQLLEKLGQAVGLTFSLPDPQFLQTRELHELLSVAGSYSWDGVRLSRILDELSRRFNIRFHLRQSGHYTVYLQEAAVRARPPEPPGGIEVRVMRLGVSTTSTIDLDPVRPPTSSGTISVQFQVDASLAEVAGLAGLDNVVARDDLGNILRTGGLPDFPLGLNGGLTASSYFVSFADPDPRATRLTWIMGDVLAYPEIRRREVEVPLPIPEGGTTQRIDDLELNIRQVRVEAQPPDEYGPQSAVHVKIEGTIPRDSPLRGRSAYPEFFIRGRSGKVYDLRSGSGSGGGEGFRVDASFSKVREPITSLVFFFTIPEEPRRVQSFRLTDIPLPRHAVLAALRRTAPPAFRPPAAVPHEPKGMAGLLLRVVSGAGPAGPGLLDVGLALREGDAWGPVRWRQVEVDTRGEARIEALKAGRYRVLRRYRPGAARPGPGYTWRGEDVELILVEGRTIAAPPLSGSESSPSPTPPSSTPRPSRRAEPGKKPAAKRPPG